LNNYTSTIDCKGYTKNNFDFKVFRCHYVVSHGDVFDSCALCKEINSCVVEYGFFSCWPPMPIWWGIHTMMGESTLHQILFELFLVLIIYIYLPKYGAFNLGLSSGIWGLGL
jgi:hypothetical protein